MAKKHVEIDTKECMSCSICIQACPVSALSLTREGKSGKYPNLFPELNLEKCIGCGICVKSCPMLCLTMKDSDA